jgi:hypothetical protein
MRFFLANNLVCIKTIVLYQITNLYETRLKFTIRPCPQLLVEPSG